MIAENSPNQKETDIQVQETQEEYQTRWTQQTYTATL